MLLHGSIELEDGMNMSDNADKELNHSCFPLSLFIFNLKCNLTVFPSYSQKIQREHFEMT
jgi:hypothetical protein